MPKQIIHTVIATQECIGAIIALIFTLYCCKNDIFLYIY